MAPKFAVDLWKTFQSPLPQINIQYKLLSEALNISPPSISGQKNQKILPNQNIQFRIWFFFFSDLLAYINTVWYENDAQGI